MKNNLVFKFSNHSIIISEAKDDVDKEKLNDTNVIDIKDLKFSTKYIEENFELVSNFLNVAIIKKNATEAIISTNSIGIISMSLINEWDHIKKVTFKENKQINMDTYFKILDNKYLNEINCFSLNDYLIERIDINKNIKVITRDKVNNSSDFMKENFLNSYSDIYYKKAIVISNNTDFEDIKAFIEINNRVKFIKIINYSNELLTTIVKTIISRKKKNILIEIDEANNNPKTIINSVSYLKKEYHEYFEEFNIKFNLKYSDKYKKENFVKELNYKLLLGLIVMIIVVMTIVTGIDYYIQYIDNNKIEDTLIELIDIVDKSTEYKNIDDNESDIEYINPDTVSTTTTKSTKKPGSGYVSAYYTNYKQVFDTLLKKNKDTVGWLKVNNTKINYPVVQGKSNSYYLNRDFNKKKNIMGWIFMDYRNKTDELDQNTLIYGHNIKTGIMFGTLKYTLNPSWYNKANNQIITFNIPGKDMKWRIFSVYKTKSTDDYLKNNFEDEKNFNDFIKLIKKRSIHDFKVDIKPDDKILTLSTCYQHTSRTVIHAVLVDVKDTIKK